MSTYDPNDLRREDEDIAPEPEEYAEDGENEEESAEYDESDEEYDEVGEYDESDEDYDGDGEYDDDVEYAEGEDEDGEDYTGDGEEDEEENLAAVAERITGMRHSQVVSAAPIRTRQEQLPAESVSQPAAPANVIPARPHPIRADGTAEPLPGTAAETKKKPRIRWKYIIPAVLLIAILGGILIAALNRSSDEAGKAGLPEGSAVTDTQASDSSPDALTGPETSGSEEASAPTEQQETQEPGSSDETESAEPAETSEQSPAASEEEPGEEPAAETPAVTEPAQDPEPASEPEPVYEPEPEPEANPEFWLQVNFYDRDPVGAMTTATTLRQFLNDRQIWLADGEVPNVGLDEWLTDYITVNVDKYEWGTETVSEVIPYTSEVTELDTIPKGTTNVLRTGENGTKETVYNIEYKNGQEFLRSVQIETVTKEPVSEQVETGVGGTILGIDGNTYSYSYRRTVQATYYNLEGLTYLGTMADESVIAVDMNYIPLGTQVYVKNDRYDFGVRTAADIGGQVDNWEIDIWLSSSNPYFPAFSREGYIYDMEIYYLD